MQNFPVSRFYDDATTAKGPGCDDGTNLLDTISR